MTSTVKSSVLKFVASANSAAESARASIPCCARTLTILAGDNDGVPPSTGNPSWTKTATLKSLPRAGDAIAPKRIKRPGTKTNKLHGFTICRFRDYLPGVRIHKPFCPVSRPAVFRRILASISACRLHQVLLGIRRTVSEQDTRLSARIALASARLINESQIFLYLHGGAGLRFCRCKFRAGPGDCLHLSRPFERRRQPGQRQLRPPIHAVQCLHQRQFPRTVHHEFSHHRLEWCFHRNP